MSLRRDHFLFWLDNDVPNSPNVEESVRNIPELNGPAVRAQVRKNSVHELVVVLIARRYGLSPLQELRKFPELYYLTKQFSVPDWRDQLSQVPFLFLQNEMISRIDPPGVGRALELQLMEEDIPDPLAFRSWFESLDVDSDLVKRLSKIKGFPGEAALYKRVRENNATVPIVIEAARMMKRSAVTGLFAMGLLTMSEIGWSRQTLEWSLKTASLANLISVGEERTRLVLRVMRAQVREEHAVEHTHEYL